MSLARIGRASIFWPSHRSVVLMPIARASASRSPESGIATSRSSRPAGNFDIASVVGGAVTVSLTSPVTSSRERASRSSTPRYEESK